MDHTIAVEPQGVNISASEDESLLEALEKAGIEIESSCGGVGTCGECVIKVLEGETSEPTLEEEDFLSPEMLESGERLACQTFPLSDLVIQIPE
jgi:ferredoxin